MYMSDNYMYFTTWTPVLQTQLATLCTVFNVKSRFWFKELFTVYTIDRVEIGFITILNALLITHHTIINFLLNTFYYFLALFDIIFSSTFTTKIFRKYY